MGGSRPLAQADRIKAPEVTRLGGLVAFGRGSRQDPPDRDQGSPRL